MTIYGLGAYPSPPDPRDHVLSASAIASAAAGVIIPDEFAVKGMPPHLDQDGTPQCTAYAGDQMKRWQEKRDNHGVRSYDHNRMYHWQKQVDGIDGDGSTGRAWCQIARTRGIPLVGKTKGVDRIAGYWRVDIGGDGEALLAAVVVYGPVMIGMEWPSNWMPSLSYHGVVPRPSVHLAGGHEVLIVGYKRHHPDVNDRLALIAWNSWGVFPGSTGGGNQWLPAEYLSERHEGGKAAVWEMWKTKDIVGD